MNCRKTISRREAVHEVIVSVRERVDLRCESGISYSPYLRDLDFKYIDHRVGFLFDLDLITYGEYITLSCLLYSFLDGATAPAVSPID